MLNKIENVVYEIMEILGLETSPKQTKKIHAELAAWMSSWTEEQESVIASRAMAKKARAEALELELAEKMALGTLPFQARAQLELELANGTKKLDYPRAIKFSAGGAKWESLTVLWREATEAKDGLRTVLMEDKSGKFDITLRSIAKLWRETREEG